MDPTLGFQHKNITRVKLIQTWKNEECSRGITNNDIVKSFYERLTNLIQSKSMKIKWEEYEIHEKQREKSQNGYKNVQEKIADIFFKLR